MTRVLSLSLVLICVAFLKAQQQPAPVQSLNTPACDILCAPAEPAKPPLPPYAGPFCERSTILGDWCGHRSKLRDCGYTLDVNSTHFYQGVTDGGLRNEFEYGGRADVILNIDGEKAGLNKGLFITLHDETLWGQSVNFATGALSPVSTGQLFPTPGTPQNALTGVKFTQFLSEKFLVFGGKLNTLDDFKQPFAGYRGVDGFMNMNFNFPLILSRTVPYSTFGAGFAVLKDLEPVLSVMVLDTNNTPTTSGFNSFFDNGTAVVGIANLPTKFFGKKGHQGIGGAYSNKVFSDLNDLPYIIFQNIQGQVPNPAPQSGSWAVYYSFDQTLGTVCCDEKRTWGAFGNAGISDGNPNPVRWNAAIGLGGSVPFANRPLDQFGVAYYYLGLSDTLKRFGRVLGDEYGIETYYTLGITPWCKITADLQVVNPTIKRVDTGVIFGVRGKLDF